MELVELLAEQFGFVTPLIEPIDSGEENSNYTVHLPDQKFLLRTYSQTHSTIGVRRAEQIEQELRFIHHLESYEVPTPLSVKTKSGDMIFKTPDNRFACLFEYVERGHPARYSHENALEIGRLLRSIREASQLFSESPTRTWKGDTAEAYLKNYHSVSAKFSAGQRPILDKLSKSVEESLDATNQLDRGFIHGDIKLGNLLFSADDKLAAVIDFDDFRQAPFISELSRTLMHDLHDPKQNVIRAGYMQQMLAGYKISQHELTYLKPLLQARFLHDAGSYISNNLSSLVDELLQDKQINTAILN